MGRFLPPDHARGDANTLGGYMAVHARPAAFEGRDGMSYSVAIETDETGDPAQPVGAFLLFLRWRRIGDQGVEGHLETGFLAYADSDEEARARLGAMPLAEVRRALDALIAEQGAPARRWWEAMREADDGA